MARSSRAPISFAAAQATARQVAAVEDRIADRLPVAAVQASPRNPRQRVHRIAELAESLRTHGLLQPVVVRPSGPGYVLIAGHRRLEAAKLLGWSEIAAVVRDETDDQAYILTLVENLQREDLTPKEEAAALEVLVRERGWSTRRVGEAIKRSPMYVSKRLRVFEDPVLAVPVLSSELTVSTAEELLRVPEEHRAELVEQAIAARWGQSDARRAVSERKVTLQIGEHLPRLAHRLRALADELTVRGDRLEALFTVALALGLRRGEALGLMWADIDLNDGLLHVRRSLQRAHGKLQLLEVKTTKSRRTVSLPLFAVRAVQKHRLRQEGRAAGGARPLD